MIISEKFMCANFSNHNRFRQSVAEFLELDPHSQN